MRLFKNANFQFVEKRKMFFVFSISLMVLSIGLLVAKGGPNYGIDFKGGSFVHVKFSSPPDLSRLIRCGPAVPVSAPRSTALPPRWFAAWSPTDLSAYP